jgi:hypothetical protein
MKAFIWDVPNNSNHSYGVAFAETVEAARELVVADVKALRIASQLKLEVMTRVMGEPDEILEPPFGYVEIECHPSHEDDQNPRSRFSTAVQSVQMPLSPGDIPDEEEEGVSK